MADFLRLSLACPWSPMVLPAVLVCLSSMFSSDLVLGFRWSACVIRARSLEPRSWEGIPGRISESVVSWDGNSNSWYVLAFWKSETCFPHAELWLQLVECWRARGCCKPFFIAFVCHFNECPSAMCIGTGVVGGLIRIMHLLDQHGHIDMRPRRYHPLPCLGRDRFPVPCIC